MARIRNKKVFDDTKTRLLKTGLALFRAKSFAAIGINDVLKTAEVPRGSFYHYFESKEVYGLTVADYYHELQMAEAKKVLLDDNVDALERLETFFRNAHRDYTERAFSHGCLMCNLSIELGDTSNNFHRLLEQQWSELSSLINECIEKIDREKLRCSHLSSQETADWLLNSWSGALIRMKAERNGSALELFFKSVF